MATLPIAPGIVFDSEICAPLTVAVIASPPTAVMALTIRPATVGASLLVPRAMATWPAAGVTFVNSNVTGGRKPSDSVSESPFISEDDLTAVIEPWAKLGACIWSHAALQVPQLSWLKSSHASLPTTSPSPQVAWHGWPGVVQPNPGSIMHPGELHPSPESLLPSSQDSPAAPLTYPSPHAVFLHARPARAAMPLQVLLSAPFGTTSQVSPAAALTYPSLQTAARQRREGGAPAPLQSA
jgi:hypothetical protein